MLTWIGIEGSRRHLGVTLGLTAWLVGSAPALCGDAQRGEPLYQRYCTGCHGADVHIRPSPGGLRGSRRIRRLPAGPPGLGHVDPSQRAFRVRS